MIFSAAESWSELEEDLPDGDSWQIKPDPLTLAQTTLYVRAYRDRLQRQADEVDEILRRMRNRPLALPRKDLRPP